MIFLRHPRTSVPPGTCYGRLEVELEPGAVETEALATKFRKASVWSSPARRCRGLAATLADGAGPHYDTRLLELHFGAWEGCAWGAISRAQSDPWAADPWTVAPPGGETFAALHGRVVSVLEEITLRAGDAAVVVTHAGVIRAARMILDGASFETVFAEPVPYACPMPLGRRAA